MDSIIFLASYFSLIFVLLNINNFAQRKEIERMDCLYKIAKGRLDVENAFRKKNTSYNEKER